MIKKSGAVGVALLLICALPLHAQRRVRRPEIRFQGAPQFTQQELLAAAGLKPGVRLNRREVRAHARRLMDTGFFNEVRFKSNWRTMLFTLTPSSHLFPMRLENVPLTPGKELDAKLHQRFPLYHGLLPASGSVDDGICHAFQQMLGVKGIKVKAALTSGLGPQKLTAVDFAVVSPAVRIGRIQLVGVSPAMQAKADLLASRQTGISFDTENTAIGLQHVFQDLYRDEGYVAVKVDVARVNPLNVSDQSIQVPYTVTIKEGGIYKLGSIDLPAGALVTRKEVKKILSKEHASGRPLDLFLLAVCSAYRANGYLDCSVVPHPVFNQAAHVVNYNLEITAGPQYRLAAVQFDGAPNAMAARLRAVWKMAPGAIFDESYCSNFAALAKKKDRHLAKWMQKVITTSDTRTDPATHEVNCILHFTKPVQSQH